VAKKVKLYIVYLIKVDNWSNSLSGY